MLWDAHKHRPEYLHFSDPAEEIFEHEAFKAKGLKPSYSTILNNLFSLTSIHPYELFGMISIPYDILARNIYKVRPFLVYEYLPLRTLYHTIFIPYDLSTYGFSLLRTFGIRTLSIIFFFCPDTASPAKRPASPN